MISRRYHRGMTDIQKATLFATVMVAVVCVSFLTAMSSADPFVLGTELNTNGQMEYLCLGRDCENIFK